MTYFSQQNCVSCQQNFLLPAVFSVQQIAIILSFLKPYRVYLMTCRLSEFNPKSYHPICQDSSFFWNHEICRSKSKQKTIIIPTGLSTKKYLIANFESGMCYIILKIVLEISKFCI